MGSDRTNNSMGPMSLIRNRKKLGIAAALVAVMGIMWVRVLVGHKPVTAAAVTAVAPAPTAAGVSPVPMKVKYVSLPVVPGRDDTIDCDFFTGRDWSGFPKSSGAASADTEVARSDTSRTSENVGKVAQKLNVQAVLMNGTPQAFINDQLVRVGDTVPVRDGTDLYLFEVKQIHDDSVLVDCGGTQVTLKM